MSIEALHVQVLWMQAELRAAKQVHLLTWQPWVGLPLPFCASCYHLQPPVFTAFDACTLQSAVINMAPTNHLL